MLDDELHVITFIQNLNVCVYVYVCAQSCLTPCDPMDYNLPDSSALETFQARVLEWVAIFYSRGSSRPRDWTETSYVSCIGRWILYHWLDNEIIYIHIYIYVYIYTHIINKYVLISWGILNLRVYLSKNWFESGSIQSRRQKGAEENERLL